MVGKFVEFCGEGTASLSVAERATIGNMAPEYGATMGFFPVDERTIDYFRGTGRTEAEIAAFEAYFKAQKMFGVPKAKDINFTKLLTLDLSTVAPSLAGPKRPQDRIEIGNVKNTFIDLFSAGRRERLQPARRQARPDLHHQRRHQGQERRHPDRGHHVLHQHVQPQRAAGGRPAGQEGRRSRPDRAQAHQDLAGPGSRVVTEYLTKTGLLPYLEKLGFDVAAYGCTTCIGNAGDLTPDLNEAITGNDLVCAAVLSGNRNFEARIHPEHQGQLPGLAAAGRGLCPGRHHHARPDDRTRGPRQARRRVLGDIWPSTEEIDALLKFALDPKAFQANYGQVKSNPGELWEHIKGVTGDTYNWPDSTYIAEPPFFQDFGMTPGATPTVKARARWACSATRSPPTTSRRPAPSRKPRPPASGSRNTA